MVGVTNDATISKRASTAGANMTEPKTIDDHYILINAFLGGMNSI